jgi:DNA-binding SARP family transcriptional activator
VADADAATYLQVFGGLQVLRGGAVAAGPPQQGLLLAALLAARGHAVAMEDLIGVL